MLISNYGKVTILGKGEEIAIEATTLLISIYNESHELFKEIIEATTDLIKTGEGEKMGRRQELF